MASYSDTLSEAEIAKIEQRLDVPLSAQKARYNRRKKKKKSKKQKFFPESAAAWRKLFDDYGMKTEFVLFTRTHPDETKRMRAEWNAKRPLFYKEIVQNNRKELLAAGVSEAGIKEMQTHGYTNEAFNIHHKIPLSGGGKNILENLSVIGMKPYHAQIHRHLDWQIKDLQVGESRWVEIAIPEGNVFVPKPDALEANKTRASAKEQRRAEIRNKKRQAKNRDKKHKRDYKADFIL